MTFLRFVWNSRIMPLAVAMTVLIVVLLGLFPAPVIRFLVALWQTIWPWLSLLTFWVSIIAMLLTVGGTFMTSFASKEKSSREEKIRIAFHFLTNSVGLAVSLKLLIVYENVWFLWPSDFATIVVNSIAVGTFLLFYYYDDFMPAMFKDKVSAKTETAVPEVLVQDDSPAAAEAQAA